MKIAITGKMRSGKDTFGEMLVERYGFEEFKFSKGITQLIQNYFPDIEGKRKMRNHYQTIGQSLRTLDKDVWVNHTNRDIEKYVADNGEKADIVVTDLRQGNEYKYLSKNGFIIVKVEAREDNRIERAIKAGDTFDMASLRHETELSVDDIPADIVITNDGSIDEFLETLDKVMTALFAYDIGVGLGNSNLWDFKERLKEVENVMIEY